MEDAGVYRYDGAGWAPSGLSGETVNAFFALDGTLFAGGTTLAYSHDDGATWTPFDDGLVGLAEVLSLSANGEQLLAGTAYGLWTRPAADLPLPTAADDAVVPSGLLLGRVGPNPASDRVTFTLALASAQTVRVEVFDALGRRVAVLHDGALPAGAHALALDGGRLAPGVYVVRATASDGAHATRRAVLLR